MKKFIMFDVGNVIIQADNNITYDILERYGVPKENARNFFDIDEFKEFSRGKINGKSFYNKLIQKYLRTDLKYEEVVKAHNMHIYGIDHSVVKILLKLTKGKEKLVFLTDTNEWQTKREKELINLRSYSDRIFRSHKIHMLKTDIGCFPYVIKKLHVEANEILLIDNSIEKVDMARQYNIQTVQFRNADQLIECLKRQNLL